jgi:rubrerythrin
MQVKKIQDESSISAKAGILSEMLWAQRPALIHLSTVFPQGDETMENITSQEAIKRSIQTEKNAMDFYRIGAKHMKNIDARKTFELLAREEREHAAEFYAIYPGDDIPDFDTFIATEPEKNVDWLSDLNKRLMGDFNDRQAMELAMEKELLLEEHLRKMAERFDDPEVKAVFLKNVESTHNHYLLIESEYARLMGMVHETDIDTFVRE